VEFFTKSLSADFRKELLVLNHTSHVKRETSRVMQETTNPFGDAFRCVYEIWGDIEAKPAREPYRPKEPKRVIVEGHFWIKRGPDDSLS
jgi:hypothetical protein